jgi:lambda family phage tail tape measure protein
MTEKIRYELIVDEKGAITSMKKLEGQTQATTAGMKKSFISLNTVVKTTVIGAVAALALQMKSLTSETLEYGDKLHKLNLQLGVSVPQLDKLRKVGALAGVEFTQITTAIRMMQKNLGDASNGIGIAKDAFGELGLNINNLLNMEPSEAFITITEALQGVENATKRNSLASQIYGARIGAVVMQMTDLRRSTEEMNTNMSQEGVNAMAAFNDTMAILSDNIKKAFVPIISGMAGAFTDLITTIDGANRSTLEFKKTIRESELKDIADTLANSIDPIALQVASFRLQKVTEELKLIDERIAELDKKAGLKFGEKPNNKIDTVTPEEIARAEAARQAATELLKMQLDEEKAIRHQGYIDKYEAEVAAEEKLRQTKNDAAEWEKNFIEKQNAEKIAAEKKALDERLALEQAHADLLKEIQDSITDSFASGLTDSLLDFADGTQTAEEAFIGFAKSFIREITQMIIKQQILNALQSSSSAGGAFGWLAGLVGSADGNVFQGGKIQPYAQGGVVTSPTVFPMANGMGLMGEAGPEAIMPLKRGADGKLGVAGGSGGDVTINTSVNVQGNINNKQDADYMANEISRQMKAVILNELQTQSRPDGFLAKNKQWR